VVACTTFDYPHSSGQVAAIVLKSTARWRVLPLRQPISGVLANDFSFCKPRLFNNFSIREVALSTRMTVTNRARAVFNNLQE
jgi:hypothetical protein